MLVAPKYPSIVYRGNAFSRMQHALGFWGSCSELIGVFRLRKRIAPIISGADIGPEQNII
jgi:hypothetical protein